MGNAPSKRSASTNPTTTVEPAKPAAKKDRAKLAKSTTFDVIRETPAEGNSVNGEHLADVLDREYLDCLPVERVPLRGRLLESGDDIVQ
ncbi:hypothetical protein GCM10008995_28580 [Halobellus salinus]|uniref:Uncharacterized protein n=1 Tax=Halobellus salinus TaxID=931585 RepID=A0A830ELF4_9EURY|nr:hypothetical protein GCM10008995_28580 [Halobellus salinus]